MSCCGKKNIVPPTFNAVPEPKKIQNNPIRNLTEAATKQPDRFKWFRDGISGIIKCFTNAIYSDKDIVNNRNTCSNCEYSSKNDNNKLTIQSQCMRPDPSKNNAPCACFIVCKTQSGYCDRWVHITTSAQKTIKTKTLYDNDENQDIEL